MVSEYETSMLTPGRTILKTQPTIGGALARLFAICVGALVILLLFEASSDRQVVLPTAVADMAAVIETLHAAERAEGRLASGIEAIPPILFLGFVEFDRNTAQGGIPEVVPTVAGDLNRNRGRQITLTSPDILE